MAQLKVREIPRPPKKYVLTLSEAEARVVRILAGHVSGAGPFRDVCMGLWELLAPVMGDLPSFLNGEIRSTAEIDAYIHGKE